MKEAKTTQEEAETAKEDEGREAFEKAKSEKINPSCNC